MRISLIDSPRKIAYIPNFSHLVTRVISGSILIAREQQDLTGGGGLPVAVADGIIDIPWEVGNLWMAAAAGTSAEVEVIIP